MRHPLDLGMGYPVPLNAEQTRPYVSSNRARARALVDTVEPLAQITCTRRDQTFDRHEALLNDIRVEGSLDWTGHSDTGTRTRRRGNEDARPSDRAQSADANNPRAAVPKRAYR